MLTPTQMLGWLVSSTVVAEESFCCAAAVAAHQFLQRRNKPGLSGSRASCQGAGAYRRNLAWGTLVCSQSFRSNGRRWNKKVWNKRQVTALRSDDDDLTEKWCSCTLSANLQNGPRGPLETSTLHCTTAELLYSVKYPVVRAAVSRSIINADSSS